MSDAACKKTAVVGFDGAVDTRAKVIKKGEESGYYSSVPDFGLELAAHAGKNCSFELEKLSVRPTAGLCFLASGTRKDFCLPRNMPEIM